MNTFVILLGFFLFLLSTGMGIYVFSHNPRLPAFRAFAATVTGIAGWNLSIFLLLAQIGPLIWPGRLAFSFVTLIAVGFALFIGYFPQPIKHIRPYVALNIILGAIAFSIPLWPSYLSWIKIVDGYITGDLNFQLFGWWTIHYVSSLLISFVFLTVRTIAFKGVDRLRLRQLLFGFVLFLVPMLATQVALPLFFLDFRFNNLGPLFTIILLIFLANGIFSYRLLDIRWNIGRSIVFGVLTVMVLWAMTTAYLFIAQLLAPQYAFVLVALLVAITYHPILHFVSRLAKKIMERGYYDPDVAMEEILDVAGKNIETDVLLTKLSALFVKYFSVQEIAFVLLSKEERKIIAVKDGGFGKRLDGIPSALGQICGDSGQKVIEAGELAWQKAYGKGEEKEKASRSLEILERAGIQQLIPFCLNDVVVGFMVFGKRHGDGMLRARDIHFLDLARSALAPAFENAVKFAEMKRLYIELSELDKAKSAFIDVVGHRFRTPLTVISWNLEMILDGENTDIKEVKDALVDTREHTAFLITTLDVLLETLVIEGRDVHLDIKKFVLGDAIAKSVRRTKAKAEELGLTFTAEIAPVEVSADAKRINLVVDSILSNSLSYTLKGGSISLAVSQEGKNAIIAVKDTGTGISKSDISKIFTKFTRSKDAALLYPNGQGIGLYLAKRIMDLHGGVIEVNSKIGAGSTFTVKLPLEVKQKAIAKK